MSRSPDDTHRPAYCYSQVSPLVLCYLPILTFSFLLSPVISTKFLTTCIVLAQQNSTGSPVTTMLSVDFTKDVANDTLRPSPLDSDSDFEAQSDYYGLPSKLVSVYHMGPRGRGPLALRRSACRRRLGQSANTRSQTCGTN